MKRSCVGSLAVGLVCLAVVADSHGRGFGGWGGGAALARGRGVGFAGGGYHFGGLAGSYGGAGFRERSGGTFLGPAGGSVYRGTGSGSYTTGRGTTIDYAGAGRAYSGPGGWDAARGIGGVHVTTPGGESYTRAGRAGGAVGPGGYAFGRRSGVGVASGPEGFAAGRSGGAFAAGPSGAAARSYRGGVAIGPQGAVAGRSAAEAAYGPRGAEAAARRSGVAVGPYGAVAGGSRGVAAAGYGTYHVSGAAFRAQGVAVRGNFAHYDCFTPAWYRRYPGAWYAAGWAAGAAWAAPTWGVLAAYGGYPAEPVYYDYGTNVVYQGDTVYVNGEPSGTPQQYAQQAAAIADTGRQAEPSPEEAWQPLGVFALVKGDEQTSYDIFQLAIDKAGVLRGNYYNALTDTNSPVYGSVDPKTQRAAWTVGEKKTPVFEAGIANLTKDETTVLVHFGEGKSAQFTLVRVKQPPEGEKKGE
ncbi:MAG TPA: hypothetical protein VIL46_02355 [Gemmataceae bacterium]